MRQTVFLLALLLLFSTNDAAGRDQQPEYGGKRLMRLVLTDNEVPNLHAVYFGRIRKSYYRFTDNYRDPSEEGPIPVQCDQTRYIGVYFRFWIAHSFHSRSADIWFEWTHSEVESANESLKHSHATDVDVGQPVLYWYEYLELSPELKVDGIMRLEATIEGHYIFSDWFELIGCNDDAKE